MTTTTTEPLPLPETGPAEVPGVKAHLGITDDRDDDHLASVVAAVNAKVRRWPVVDPARGEADWSMAADAVEGSTLLAARLFRRKDSPAGVAALGADFPVYVMRTDPDVAMLLGLGTWSGPEVG